jgi:putative protease
LFLSPELDAKSFGFSPAASEALGYGRLPLMHTETCIIRNIKGDCTHSKGQCRANLVDRTGASFPVLRGNGHRNLIYNSIPTYRLDKRKEYKKSGVGLMTLLFTTETEAEMLAVVNAYRTSAPPKGQYTRR